MNRAQPRLRPTHSGQTVPRLTVVAQRQSGFHPGRARRDLNGNSVGRRAAGADSERAGRGHLRLGED